LMYVGDTRLEVLTTYALSSDDRLPRKALFLFDVSRSADGLTQSRYPHFHRQVIPPFSLWWVAMVHDFSQWRDDLPFVRARMSGVRAVIDYFAARLNAENLLVAPSGWNFIDWVKAWKNGVPKGGNEGGISGPISWQLAWNLRLASELEELVGEPELAARGRRLARQIAAAADATFWDETRGLYADDLAHTSFSEHSQCLALLSGLAPEKRFLRLAHGLLTDQDLHRCTVYFSHYLFETLRLIGHTERIIERLDVWFNHHTLGMKTLLEMPEPSRSDCHAWAAHPLFQYGTTFLGVRPAAPGFASVSIAPQLGTLTWAAGTVAHPKGPIQVALKRHGDALSAIITLPPGLTGTLAYAGTTYPLIAGTQTVEVVPVPSDRGALSAV
jgi:alpha-L-rhamnosidase